MIMKSIVALGASFLALFAAPTAHADFTCQFPVVVLAIAGPVTLICGEGNSAVTTHTNEINPSLQVDPHLFAPAPN